MKMIQKYELEAKEEASIEMPADAKIIHIAWQFSHIGVWAEVTPKTSNVIRNFCVYRTLREIPDDPGFHIGSVMAVSSRVAFHVYEIKNGGN